MRCGRPKLYLWEAVWSVRCSAEWWASSRTSKGDWVAKLECGHGLHVRHNPPWEVRAWVITEAGRAERVGRQMECKLLPGCGDGAGVSEPWILSRGSAVSRYNWSHDETETHDDETCDTGSTNRMRAFLFLAALLAVPMLWAQVTCGVHQQADRWSARVAGCAAASGDEEDCDGHPHPAGGKAEGEAGGCAGASGDRRRPGPRYAAGGGRYAGAGLDRVAGSGQRLHSRRCRTWTWRSWRAMRGSRRASRTRCWHMAAQILISNDADVQKADFTLKD